MKRLNVFPQRMKKNMELTRGLIFSQRVMLALIDKGLSRQNAYELVQHNAMKSWQKGRNFISLLKADADVVAVMTPDELETIFNYQHYLRNVDYIFRRVGLTSAQWKKKPGDSRKSRLSPRGYDVG
jgi:adenylosuccinate lyase